MNNRNWYKEQKVINIVHLYSSQTVTIQDDQVLWARVGEQNHFIYVSVFVHLRIYFFFLISH